MSPPRPTSSSRPPGPRGFVLADALMGLAIVSILTAALTASVVRAGRNTDRLADQRAAVQSLESALVLLAAGTPPPPGITVERLTPPWVRLSTNVGRSGHIELTGTLPALPPSTAPATPEARP